MKLLLQHNEYPLIASPELAKVLGITAATFLQKLYFLISETRKRKTKKNLTTHKGRKWWFHTYEEWQATLGMFSVSTIKRAVAKLKKLGLIKIAKLSEIKSIRVNYYTIDYSKLKEMFGINVTPTIAAEPKQKPTPHQDKIVGTQTPSHAPATPEQLKTLPDKQRQLYNQLRTLKLDISHTEPLLEIWVHHAKMISAYVASASSRLDITKWHWHTPQQILPNHLLD
ncbi:hypothetical protein QE380_002701 [Acinetobacter baylyi]|uniref:Replication protein n=1 Tax=Acinetobacter baylyi TaxID=202950 RepID=A0ABU0UYZ9_ACIBI|nr:hypothetical protein [Acinetobacter baylyi]MDQ1209778.1 hypothetical protein [Acinetobacter baylyi]MDR6106624.1 hypothetical protein [Acinetobacter baylyi]MDR6186647.1 hypothetical protein [Acinetobacter baylyi]